MVGSALDLALDETKNLIDQINAFRDEYGTLNHPNINFKSWEKQHILQMELSN